MINSLSLNKSSINLKKGFYLFSFYLISIVLLFSGISKTIDPQPLIETIQSIKLIGDNFVAKRSILIIALATILPVIEITFGVMLLLKMNIRIILLLTTILFGFFFLFSIYGFTIDLENDCGCLGSAVQSNFGWWMIIRNFLLLIVTIYLTANKKNNPGAGEK